MQENDNNKDKNPLLLEDPKLKNKMTFWEKWIPLMVLSLALAIVVIDNTLLNVSLSTIIRELHTDIQSLQWVITAYALMLAAFTILGGKLGDMYGRKKMFVLGAIIFAIGSLVASISPNVGILILGESIIEGIGAALMLPATTSILVSMYQGRDRATAFGVWGGVAAASSAIGPIIGGYLTSNFSWRWGFRINVVVVILLVAGAYLIKESYNPAEKDEQLDEGGILLSSVGMLAIVFGIIESSKLGLLHSKEVFSFFGHQLKPEYGYSIVIPSIIFGIITLGIFVYWESLMKKWGREPLIDVVIFENKTFTIGALTTAISFMGMSGIIFSIPIFLQAVRSLDAFHTGLALLPLSISLLISAPFAAYISKYLNPKYLIQIGLVISFGALYILYESLSIDATAKTLIPGLFVYGLGIGLMISQTSNITLSAVSVKISGEASGINNTFRQLGQTLGSAIIGAVLLSTLGANLVSGVNASTNIPDNLKSEISKNISSQSSNVEFGGGIKTSDKIPDNIQKEIVNIADKATVVGNKKALLFAMLFIFLGFIMSFFLPKIKQPEHGEKAPVAGH